MADILIRGMEMPTSCALCRLRKGPRIDMTCFDHSALEAENRQTRPNWCPLIALPEGHGRLIDADAYKAEMKKRQDACAEWRDDIKDGGGYGTELYYRADSFLGAMCEAKLTLDKTPTIVPADKEDTQ